MINFLFGFFQSSNALRYTFKLLWRLKVDIWLSLSSLQFTDTYQVLHFASWTSQDKGFFPSEKNKLIDALLIFIVLYCGRNEFEFLCLRGKGCKGICYVPCGPQMLLLLPPCSGNLLWCRLWPQRDKKKHEFPASCRGQKLLWTKWKKNELKQHFGRNFGRASIINRHACIMHKGLFFLYIQVYGCFTEQFQ